MRARRRLVTAAVALVVGGAGTAGASVARAAETPTVVCPNVASELADVPDAAQAEVDQELADLEQQIDDADAALARDPDQSEGVLNDLRVQRSASIDRIAVAVTQAGSREPRSLRRLARCDLLEPDPPAPAPTRRGTPRPTSSQDRSTPSPTPSSSVSCPDVAQQVAGTDDDEAAERPLRLAGLGTLAECASPGPTGASPSPAGPGASGAASVLGAGLPSATPTTHAELAALNAGPGLDLVTVAAIVVLLLAGLTFLLIRADVVRLTRVRVSARRRTEPAGSGPEPD